MNDAKIRFPTRNTAVVNQLGMQVAPHRMPVASEGYRDHVL